MGTYEDCPKCHAAIEFGYGLAFGGFGAYQYCENDACDWHEKDRECPVCEGVDEHDADCTETTPPKTPTTESTGGR